MSVIPGARIGPYEILAGIGAGGMGEVYRARDTRLDRQAAIKLLPIAFAADAERVARFEREAKVLASLNHPNIATVYGLEDVPSASGASARALVMELVEGPTLADRIAAGPMSTNDVAAIARQIAAALDAAHEQGIVHRDLKPANVKVREDGTVKVLDFGLAKMIEPAAASGELADSPTITSAALTERGVILGTAAYMAPEQARGRFVDRRADIWAFGAVLFEMLTGRRAFGGEDASETLAAILKQEPKYDAVPAVWQPLLRRCLTKDPKKRLRDIGDAALDMDALADRSANIGSDDTALHRRARAWRLAAICAAAAAAGALALETYRPVGDPMGSGPSPSAAIFDVLLPPATTLSGVGRPIAISPGGQTLAYVAEHLGVTRIYVRDLGAIDTKPIDVDDARSVSFSPNGQRLLVLLSNGRIVTTPVHGGPVESSCNGTGSGIAWLDDEAIVFGRGGLFRTPRATCDAKPVTTLAANGMSLPRWPSAVPASHMVVFENVHVDRGVSTIDAVDITNGKTHEVTQGGSPIAVSPGWLFFARRRDDGGRPHLLVAPLDPQTATMRGQPAVIADGVDVDGSGGAHYSVSATGTLTYAPSVESVVRILGPSGDPVATFPVSPDADMIAVSPDGRRAVVTYESRMELVELERGRTDRIVLSAGQIKFPTWLPDGRRISYRFQPSGQTTYQVEVVDLAGGAREVVMTVSADPRAGGISTWSRDARTAFGNYVGPNGNHDLFRLSLDGSREPTPVLATPAFEANARLSPDGRLLAFIATYVGGTDVFVQPVQAGERVRVSANGGSDPQWTPDGNELIFRKDNRIFSAAVNATGGRLSVGEPRLIAERPVSGRLWAYGVMPDGRRLVTLERAAPVSALRVVLNWPRLALSPKP